MAKITKVEEFQGEDLVIEMIGIVDVEQAAKDYSEDLLFDFFTKGHPARNKAMKPCSIKVIKTETHEHAPFAIFVAIKELNPSSDRPLVTREAIEAYKARYPFVLREEEFDSWDEVLRSI